MVKKKGKSKRTTLKDKYKVQRRVLETNRKRKKQGKRDALSGKVVKQHAAKDPGIPNAWPFKQELLLDIQRTKQRQEDAVRETKEQRGQDLAALRDHRAAGGAARTVAELAAQAAAAHAAFALKQEEQQQEDGDAETTGAAAKPKKKGAASRNKNNSQGGGETARSDGAVAAGQQSRRAYLRELKKVVDASDVLLQVLDARDPVSTRMHPATEHAILSRPDKRMVLVLNKIDLVPKAVVSDWLVSLRRSHPTVAVKAGSASLGSGGGSGGSSSGSSSKKGDGETNNALSSQVPVGMDGLLQLLKNYARTSGSGSGNKKSKTCIVVGIIGYPNTGKSSIINALKRCRAVSVSSVAGCTTALQEVVLDRNVRLLDSPGVVFDDQAALLGNCVDPESIPDPVPPVAALLQRCNHASLLLTYNIPAFPEKDVMQFLALVAKSYGRVLKGGIPDKVAAARAVLKDWNSGKIPYYTVPPKFVSTASEAVVVSSFAKEFDLFDDSAVLKSLKDDADELDFVKLENDDNADMEMDETARQAIDFFADEEEDDDDDEMDEDDSSNDDDDDDAEEEVGSAPSYRAKLAKADDYDFDDM